MAWLLRRGEVLASLELTSAAVARGRALRRCGPADCAVLVNGSRAAHTIGLAEPVDVAYLDDALVVLATTRMAPHRIGLPRRHAGAVLAARAGAFERWRLRPGDALEVSQ